ncbi:ionotropic receptor 93a-like [Homarus americanus]|nr:ionotropic receptor 93a-like [Homarus americanus]
MSPSVGFVLLMASVVGSLAVVPLSVPSGEVEALRQVLEASSQPQCSLIILTDGTTSHLTHHQLMTEMGRSAGVVVLEVDSEQDHNTTKMMLSHALTQARTMRVLSWCVTVVVVSDSPSFLATFAASSDSGRLLVWTTKMLVVTRVPLPELRHLLHHYWVFSMMNTMFLTLADASHDRRCEVHVYLPYSTGGPQVVGVASWTPGRGLSLNTHCTLFPDKYKNLHGANLNMTVFPFSPYWMEVEQQGPEGVTTSRRTGRDYLILETIAGALNFSINVLPYGDWDEVMRRLEERVAFVSPIKLAIMPHLQEIYDFTFVIEPATLGFSMAKPTLKPRWQSLYYPLSGEVWVSILAVLLLVPAVLLMINYASEGNEAGHRLKVWTVVQEVFGTLLGQTFSKGLPSKSSTRVLMATWLVFSFIVGIAYRGNLTAFLTVPKYPTRAENLEQLITVGAT